MYNENEFKKEYGRSLESYLSDPQLLNGYSYSRNNPIVLVDKDGNFVFLAPLIAYAIVYAVPLTITAVAAVGAYFSAKEYGQALGYHLGGDSISAQQHLDNSIMADVGTAASVGGLLMYDQYQTVNNKKDYIVPGQTIKSSSQVPKYINEQIPEEWGPGRQADNSKGWVWTDPANKNNEIRYMSGNPNNPYQNSQTPYVRVSQDIGSQKRYFDAYGNIGVDRSSETHFYPKLFNINNYNF